MMFLLSFHGEDTRKSTLWKQAGMKLQKIHQNAFAPQQLYHVIMLEYATWDMSH